MALLALEGVSKSYDGRTILDAVDLTLDEGERVGLVGPNGGGKSTLLRMLVAAETPDEGTRTLRRALRFGYLEQEPFVDPTLRGCRKNSDTLSTFPWSRPIEVQS